MPEEAPKTPARRLATIETITSVNPILNADAIVRSRVRGWDVVTRLEEFQAGDTCLYIEVDAFIPANDLRFEFLAKRGVRKDANDNDGYVLKTASLRGVYSQGLALPISMFPEIANLPVGSDVTELLNIVIWEPKIPEELLGLIKGYRPSWIPATDEDRIQNVSGILSASDVTWIATEKIDGNSTTVYVDGYHDNELGVCTRNLDLIEDHTETLWSMILKLNLHEQMMLTWPGQRVVIQGETYGEGLHGNPLKIKGRKFAAFTLRLDSQEIPRNAWPAWLLDLSVPVHEELTFPTSLEIALSDVEKMYSKVNPECLAEGIVWRALDTASIIDPEDKERLSRASFKVISNRYLLKHDR